MWVCNLCRKQQEILTKSGAWFYPSGPGQVRGVFEGGPQGKKAKLQDPSLYPYHGTSGDLTPASDRSRPHGGLLPRQASLDNGSGLRYPGPGDAATDRSAGNESHTGLFLWVSNWGDFRAGTRQSSHCMNLDVHMGAPSSRFLQREP